MKRHERCRIGGSSNAKVKYHYSYRFFTYSVKREANFERIFSFVVLRQRYFICVADDALKTASGGEFDWGGTSVKE